MSKKVSLIDATRKREEFVRAGESGGTEHQLPVHTATQNSVDTVIKKATFNLTAALHQRLKIAAAVNGREMVELVSEALEEHLNRLEDRSKHS